MSNRGLLCISLALMALGTTTSCADGSGNYEGGPIAIVVAPGSTASLMLYLSNQSHADETVFVEVMLDGDSVINRKFAFGDGHNYVPFLVTLSPGSHTLEATSSTEVMYSVKFQVLAGQQSHALLSYWYYPKKQGDRSYDPRKFEFKIQDEPLAFS